MRALVTGLMAMFCSAAAAEPPFWVRHTIDRSSRGADGVRIADVNRDGRPDFVTGWEEGGQVSIYLHPGSRNVHEPWAKTVVGKVKSPEDAFFVDFDSDGVLDIVSCCEGKTRTAFLHRRPRANSDAWTTVPIPATQSRAMWMFGIPLQVDGEHGIDIVLGAKGAGAEIGWLRAPADPSAQDQWTWQPFHAAGWIMSIEVVDMNGDGRVDVLYTDRKGPMRGCHWLEAPAVSLVGTGWKRHTLGGIDREVMFLARGDVDGDGLEDIACAVRGADILLLRRTTADGVHWQEHTIAMPNGTGTGKGVAIGDADADGQADVFFTCENAAGKHGVGWLGPGDSPLNPNWTFHPISGLEGTKFDLIQLLDLDDDGDLDLITCEERENLGVIWYENPNSADSQ